MSATFIVASQAELRQRLDTHGLAALGLGSPLLSPAWTTSPLPSAQQDASPMLLRISTTANSTWLAPIAGMLVPVTDGRALGLSAFDGTPAALPGEPCVVLHIHPQARLRVERQFVAALQGDTTPVDVSLRPAPATILIRNPSSTQTVPQLVTAGEAALPTGDVTMHDEHGLPVDPFAFAATVDTVLNHVPVLRAPLPDAEDHEGTVAAVAGLAEPGRFVYAVDLHGRPWPGSPGGGVGFFTGDAGQRTAAGAIPDGGLYAWPDTDDAVLGVVSDPDGTTADAGSIRLGWATVGLLTSSPLTWPAAEPTSVAGGPVRDTLRLAVADPHFHLLGNRMGATRDGVGGADTRTVAEAAPLVRLGSPLTLLPDGRSVLGWMGQVFDELLGDDGTLTTGPILAASVEFDDATWSLPTAPGPAGAWPVSPPAPAVPGSAADVLAAFAPLRTQATAHWVNGTNDVLVRLPDGLPSGAGLRLYPVSVQIGQAPDQQPLLLRADGNATVLSSAADAILLADPFRLGPVPQRPGNAILRVDAVITWQPPGPSGPVPQVRLIASLAWPVGPDVPAPSTPGSNLLAAEFWKGTAHSPLHGASATGTFTLSDVLGDPAAFIRDMVRQLSTDQNPREAPRLPTMGRLESLWVVRLQSGADRYRAVLTGGWLTRETDAHAPRLANPGGAGTHEIHAPGLAATAQLGFDLWVAALHRARPIVPTATVADVLTSGPNAGLANNWYMLQADDNATPPDAPAPPDPVTLGESPSPSAPPEPVLTTSAAVLQTVPAFVETPELGLVPDDDESAATNWINEQLGQILTTPNQPELHRQLIRELHTAKHGRRDAQWALRRALRHARELVYIEAPLFGATAHEAGPPSDTDAAVDLVTELAVRLQEEPRLRVVLLTPRTPPFAEAFAPWAAFAHGSRHAAVQALQQAAGTVANSGGTRPRVVVAHPIGIPGRPLLIRTTTVIVDDVWCLIGTSTLTRRGLTFDGATDIVLTDWRLERGAGIRVRAFRKALMAGHLGVGPGSRGTGGGTPPNSVGAPSPDWVRLHQPGSAADAFADVLAAGGGGKLLPLWSGPDTDAPGAVPAHPAEVADPDGRNGASFVTALAAVLHGQGEV